MASEIGDPFKSLCELREREPVCPVHLGDGAPSAVVVLRYEDVARVLAESATYSPSVVGDRYGAVLGGATAVSLEGPAHRRIRKLMGDRLKPSSMREVATETVRPLVDEALTELADDPRPDLVRDLASQLPARVITSILGFEPEQTASLAGIVTRLFNFAENPRDGIRAARRLRRMCRQEIARHRSQGVGHDLTSALLAAQVGGQPLDDDAIVAILLLLLGAGTKTTADAFGTTLHTLISLGMLAEIANNPSHTPSLIEESLRLQSPAQIVARVAVRDSELSGVTVAAGTLVLAHIGSANRDELAFHSADDFVVDRPVNPPSLAFGWGEHRCLGLHLARAELESGISALSQRHLTVTFDRPREEVAISGGLFRTVRQMPVRLH